MSFFKLEDTILHEAPNFVHAPDYELLAEHKHLYKYPIFDWYWFDAIEEARVFFNISEPMVEETPNLPEFLPTSVQF